MSGAIRHAGARSPEELETLFEDALVIRDGGKLSELFDEGSVLITNGWGPARGVDGIVRLALATWQGDDPYVADPQSVSQALDIALIVAERSINVARRGRNGAWRYAIVHQAIDECIEKEKTVTQAISQAIALDPVVVAGNAGEARWWFSSLAVIKATAADTGGQMTIVEITAPAGDEAPLHVHHREDEGFWILEGDAIFEVGDRVIEAHAGDYLFGPRGIPHRYTVGSAGCRMLFIVTPGGFENLVLEMSKPAASRTLPPPSDEEPDWKRIAAIAKAHGNELLV